MFELSNEDALSFLKRIPTASIDAIITDPPYGTTNQVWDAVIPFEPMWQELKRIRKPFSPIVLFAAQPFTSTLITSNIKEFKYQWVWVKNAPGGFAQAKNKPMPIHEDIVIFSDGTTGHACQSDKRMPYYPQGLVPYGKTIRNKIGTDRPSAFEARANMVESYVQEFTGYPDSVLCFDVEREGLHANQKPVPLMQYLIETYTLPGEKVLDFTCGSGSTGVAAIESGRHFIGNDNDFKSFAVARRRLKEAEKTAKGLL